MEAIDAIQDANAAGIEIEFHRIEDTIKMGCGNDVRRDNVWIVVLEHAGSRTEFHTQSGGVTVKGVIKSTDAMINFLEDAADHRLLLEDTPVNRHTLRAG